ncbi:uncharacterized protein LOC142175808 [Nicotiana tabacum]|uniref:Uncharacterized protein LOC142175808 n=1 Tax=Nicotiana tabacum TaxID=4097 RepID=A0AC58TNU9_TOBAC
MLYKYLQQGKCHVAHTRNVKILEDLTLRDVLHVLDFKFNLMSVSKLTRELSCCPAFFPDFCIFQDLYSGKVLEIGKEHNGLYLLKKELNKKLSAIAGNIVQVQEDSALWHIILDHPSTVAMQHIPLLKNKMNTKLQYGCKVCSLAKQNRLPFQPSISRTDQIFQLVHVNVWGSHRIPTYDRKHYFVTLVDEFNRYTWNQEEVDVSNMNSDPLATDAVEEAGGISPEGDVVNDVRKSARPSRPPIWIKDYVTTWTFIGNSLYPISQGLSYANLTVGYQSYLKAFSAHIEPDSFKDAVQDSRWVEAMQWEIRKQAIGSKWVYKIKYKANGEVERFKARLVAKYYNQNEGLDYHDTFSPVAKVVTVRTIISIAAAKGWNLHQMDVNNVFLQGDLYEDMYIGLPQGFHRQGERKVCNLLNKRQGSDMVIILVYVDDLLITGSSPQLVNDAKKTLQSQFKVKDLGELRYFLGIEVLRSQKGDSTEPKKIYT